MNLVDAYVKALKSMQDGPPEDLPQHAVMFAGKGGAAVVDVGGRCWWRGDVCDVKRRRRILGRRGSDDDLGVTATEANLDRPGGQIDGDLAGSVGQGLEQHQPHAGLQRRQQPFGHHPGLLAPGLGRRHHLTTELLDVPVQIHDVTMPPL